MTREQEETETVDGEVVEDSTELVPLTPEQIALQKRGMARLAAESGWSQKDLESGNVLVFPAYVRQISELHQAKLERIAIEVPPKGEDSTDLYRMQGKLAPTKHLLERIAMLAGIKWDPERSKFDYVGPDSVVYTAVGGIRGPGGEMIWVAKTREWLLEAEVIEIEERAVNRHVWENGKKRPATEAEKAAYVRTEIARSKAHRISNVETKAKNRVIRSLTGIPNAESAAYWARPMFIPRIDLVLDAHDPMTRGLLIGEGIAGRDVLGFAQRPAGQLAPVEDAS